MEHTNRTARILSAALSFLITLLDAHGTITFTPGDYYASDSNISIAQYNASGIAIGSLTVSYDLAHEIHGIAFGNNGLLYAVCYRFNKSFDVVVLGLDSSGTVQETYKVTNGSPGNATYGKIAIDDGYIYVASGEELVRFTMGTPSSRLGINFSAEVFDVEILPNGNLIVALKDEVREVTASGGFVRRFDLQDTGFYDVRGVEYDPVLDNLFVTQHGLSGKQLHVLRIDGSSGTFEGSTSFNYANDLFLTQTGDLLIGSTFSAPRIYTQNLDQIGVLGTGEKAFVTQFNPVPEPTGGAILIVAGAMLISTRRKRHPSSR